MLAVLDMQLLLFTLLFTLSGLLVPPVDRFHEYCALIWLGVLVCCGGGCGAVCAGRQASNDGLESEFESFLDFGTRFETRFDLDDDELDEGDGEAGAGRLGSLCLLSCLVRDRVDGGAEPADGPPLDGSVSHDARWP